MIGITVLMLLGAGFIVEQIWVVWRELRAAADDVDFIESAFWAQSLAARSDLATTP